MANDNPNQWRWYHHVLLVLFVAVFATIWSWLKPSERVSNIVLAVSALVFVVTFTIIQIRKRRQREV